MLGVAFLVQWSIALVLAIYYLLIKEGYIDMYLQLTFQALPLIVEFLKVVERYVLMEYNVDTTKKEDKTRMVPALYGVNISDR